MVFNGDIETDTTGWTALYSSTIERNTTEHYTGVASLAFQCTGTSQNQGAGYALDVKPQRLTNITLNAWIKASAACTVQVDIRHGTTDHVTTQSYSITTDWQQITINNVSMNKSDTMYVYYQILGFSSKKVYIDNFSLVEYYDPNKSIVCVGDSITWGTINPGTAAMPWPEQLQNRLPTGWTVFNSGIGGQTPTQMLARWSWNVTAIHPKYVIILAGVNNVDNYLLEEQELYTMYQWAESNGTIPIACKILPYWNYHANVTVLNTWIEANATANGRALIDFYTLMDDPDSPEHLNSDWTIDGLHPNQAGYDVMAAYIDLGLFGVHGNEYTITASQTTVTESDTTITLTIHNLNYDAYDGWTSNVTISAIPDTATEGSDYTFTNHTFTFNYNTQQQTVVLSIKGHPIQTDRTFTVALSNPTGNSTLGSPNSILITIQPKSEIMEGGVVITQYWPVLIVILFVGFIIAATVVMLMLLRSGRGNPNTLIVITLAAGVAIIIIAVVSFVGTMLYDGLF